MKRVVRNQYLRRTRNQMQITHHEMVSSFSILHSSFPGPVVELVDTHVLEACLARGVGSSPTRVI